MRKKGRPNQVSGITVDQIEAALRNQGGFLSYAAEELNCSQANISQRIKRSERLRKTLREIEESYLDLAESKLLNKVNMEDLGAICFYLKCKGKRRGYIEKQAIELSGDEKAPVRIERVIVGKEDITD